MQDTSLPTRLGKPAERALTSAGISSIEQLTDWRESDLKKLHGIGPKAMGQLLTALQERGLSFKD